MAPPADPPAPSAPPENKTPPVPPEPPAPKQKTEAEIAQELEARRIATEEAKAKATKLTESKKFFSDAKLTARDMLRDPETETDAWLALVDRLVDEGQEAGKLLAQDEVDYSGRDAVVQEHNAFKDEVINSYFEALPDALHGPFIEKVNGKRAGEWVKALLEAAPSVPSVKEAVYNDALATAQELVPQASRADFDAELGKTSKDLKGLLHAAYQAGFMTQAPRGSRPVAETGGGAMDIERWRKDRTFRKSMTPEENNRYHAESMRQQKDAAGL